MEELETVLNRLNEVTRLDKYDRGRTLGQLTMLLRIVKNPGQTMTEICVGICSTAGATLMVDVFVKLGMIHRIRRDMDRRIIRVAPTVYGLNVIAWVLGEIADKPQLEAGKEGDQ